MLHFLAAVTMTLQLADAHSTIHAPGVELNPIMRPLVAHPAALYAVKAGAGSVVVLTTRAIAKRHPQRAIWFAVAINVAQGAVVVHNWRR